MAAISLFQRLPRFAVIKTTIRKFYHAQKTLTSQEVAAALRPFYFSVHPDLFWQHPHEKEINENSLKHLNSYLESLSSANYLSTPTNLLTFYVRQAKQGDAAITGKLKAINIKLMGRDLHRTVHGILKACNLSTDYLDKLKSPTISTQIVERLWQDYEHAKRCKQELRNAKETFLGEWLIENRQEAFTRSQACRPIREEIQRLRCFLMETLFLRDIIWDCGWDVLHFRGCLLSFYSLVQHYPDIVGSLKGRIVVFGKRTGVSLDGHIVLSSGDVKHTWLDLLQSIPDFDVLLGQVPYVENSLSEVLRGMTVDHRKFRPIVMVQKYLQQLGKLTSALYKFRWQSGYPNSWPRRLDKYQLVVESEAGPLMLSPTGQFIAPASCPAFLLVDFISVHMSEADERLVRYESDKQKEEELCNLCRTVFGLASLEKDDNVTPDLMIDCCQRLIDTFGKCSFNFMGCHLRISNYYSLLQNGDVCIPWNWKN